MAYDFIPKGKEKEIRNSSEGVIKQRHPRFDFVKDGKDGEEQLADFGERKKKEEKTAERVTYEGTSAIEEVTMENSKIQIIERANELGVEFAAQETKRSILNKIGKALGKKREDPILEGKVPSDEKILKQDIVKANPVADMPLTWQEFKTKFFAENDDVDMSDCSREYKEYKDALEKKDSKKSKSK